MLVFSPNQSNVLYSFKLKLLKTESELRAFLIKRLKIITCQLDALKYIFDVLVLTSIIGRKCYLFGTFQLNAPKLYSLVLVLIGNTLLYLILCEENVLLKHDSIQF